MHAFHFYHPPHFPRCSSFLSVLNPQEKHTIREKLLSLLDEEDSAVRIGFVSHFSMIYVLICFYFVDCQNACFLRGKDSKEGLPERMVCSDTINSYCHC